jgi:hypothetical protein
MPLFHIDAETLEHRSTHRAMEKLSQWFHPARGNEGGNYVLYAGCLVQPFALWTF